jgi:CRISPR-associated protein Cmr1
MGFNISRYKRRIKSEFEIEVITPMFLAGANTHCAELRAPSIKGALRFWWRAISNIPDIRSLKQKEGEVFGDTTYKASTIVHVEPIEKLAISKELKTRGYTFPVHGRNVHILDYLAYGTHKYEKGKGNVYHKEHIAPGSRFRLKIDSAEKHAQEVLLALAWMIHYGGIGARSRNGFGSMATTIERPDTRNFLDPVSYSAVSKDTRLFTFTKKNSWQDAHSEVGLAYRTARLSIEKSHRYDRRKLISAPITVKRRNVADLERHAKPYFLHISKLANNTYQGQILYMPYKYLAQGPDYRTEKLADYNKACEDINKKLQELAGGVQ